MWQLREEENTENNDEVIEGKRVRSEQLMNGVKEQVGVASLNRPQSHQ